MKTQPGIRRTPVRRERVRVRSLTRIIPVRRERVRALSQKRIDQKIARHQRYLETGDEYCRARFRRLALSGRRFEGTLSKAEFQGAELRGCVFKGNFLEADFSGADLERADLSQPEDLSEHRFGAAHLKYALLPPYMTFANTAAVREHATRAERLLATLLAACATVVVLTFVIAHEDLLLQADSINLPVLSLPVPVRTFFVLAPWLLLVLYAFLLSTLLKFWSGQRALPAVSVSNRASFRDLASSPNFAVMPFGTCWPVTPLGERRLTTARRKWAEGTHVDRLVVLALVWAAVPLTILTTWLTYLPRHTPGVTYGHVLALAAAVVLGATAYARMMAHFRSALHLPPGETADPGQTLSFRDYVMKVITPSGALLLVKRKVDAPHADWPREKPALGRLALLGLVVMVWGGAFSWAQMYGAECGDGADRFEDRVTRCHVFGARLRHAQLDSQRMNHENLRRAFLADASLRGAQLERAHLQSAQLNGAKMQKANLKDALLNGALLWEANLTEAKLKEAELRGADLRGAILRDARLQGADLRGAKLQGADFRGAVLCGADLRQVELGEGAPLGEARGTEFATFTDTPVYVPLRSLPRSTAPSYLTASEQHEHRRWLAADDALAWLRSYVTEQSRPRGVLDRAALVAAVKAIDVSMGANTQRRQIRLVRWLERQPGTGYGPATISYTTTVRARLRDFEDKVQEKAANHCVASYPDSLPLSQLVTRAR